MNRLSVIGLLAISYAQVAMAQPAVQLVGTWNVTATQTGDTNFDTPPKGGANAYVWIVSATASGEVTVAVQGETAFPKLTGRWNAHTRTLILRGNTSGLGGRTACWFKLVMDQSGQLKGVRRYIDSTPGFVDFEVVARRS